MGNTLAASASTEICLLNGFPTVTVKVNAFGIKRKVRVNELCECVCESVHVSFGCGERIKRGYVNNGMKEPLNIRVGCAREILLVMSPIPMTDPGDPDSINKGR